MKVLGAFWGTYLTSLFPVSILLKELSADPRKLVKLTSKKCQGAFSRTTLLVLLEELF